MDYIVFINDKAYLKIANAKKVAISEDILLPEIYNGKEVDSYQADNIVGKNIIIKLKIGQEVLASKMVRNRQVEDEPKGVDAHSLLTEIKGLLNYSNEHGYSFKGEQNRSIPINWRKFPAGLSDLHNKEVLAGKLNNEIVQVTFSGKQFMDECAVAPYNFIPLNPEVAEDTNNAGFEQYGKGLLSGHIDLLLETQTPLFIRGEKQSFFKVNGKPAIPGSSLRGMIRNLVEIASWGKLEFVDDEKMFYRAVADTSSIGEHYKAMFTAEEYNNGQRKINYKTKSGWLKKRGEEYFLYPSIEVSHSIESRNYKRQYYRTNTAHFNGIPIDENTYKEIYFNPSSIRPVKEKGRFDLYYFEIRSNLAFTNPGNGFQRAFLVKTGHMDKKHYEWVINPPDFKTEINVTGLMEEYAKDKNRDTSGDLLDRLKNSIGEIPCFYLEANNEIRSIGHTGMHRLANKATLKKIVRQNNSEKTDFASAMFGTTEKAGRIYFEDAKIVDKGMPDFLEHETVALKILAGPKPTTFQHYLEQPCEHLTSRKQLHHWDTDNAQIRGHKLYWHRKTDAATNHTWQAEAFEINKEHFIKFLSDIRKVPNAKGLLDQLVLQGQFEITDNEKLVIKKSISELQKDFRKYVIDFYNLESTTAGKLNISKPQNSLAQPVENAVFSSRIRFDNLTTEELGCLLFVIQLPDGCYHKLGTGKSLGLGSIKITPTPTIIDRQSRYSKLFEKSDWCTGEEDRAEQEITDYKNAFAAYICKAMKIPFADYHSLWDSDRLKQLKTMLTFQPIMDNDEWLSRTRYMDINNREFRYRPVLPYPGEVISNKT